MSIWLINSGHDDIRVALSCFLSLSVGIGGICTCGLSSAVFSVRRLHDTNSAHSEQGVYIFGFLPQSSGVALITSETNLQSIARANRRYGRILGWQGHVIWALAIEYLLTGTFHS
jgi:hypothetical protein